MSEFSILNYTVRKNWKDSLAVAFQQLRRVLFVTDQTFVWQDFNPQINFAGMTTSNISVRSARYLKINKLLYVSIDFSVTLAAPLANNISVIIPATTAGTETGATGAAVAKTQCFPCTSDFNTGEVGLSTISAGTNILYFTRPGNINYLAAGIRIAANGILEIK